MMYIYQCLRQKLLTKTKIICYLYSDTQRSFHHSCIRHSIVLMIQSSWPHVTALHFHCWVDHQTNFHIAMLFHHSTSRWRSFHSGNHQSTHRNLVSGSSENHWFQHLRLKQGLQHYKEHSLGKISSRPPKSSNLRSVCSNHQLESRIPSHSHTLNMEM